MDKKERYESMLFNYETTSRTDYQPTPITAPVKTEYKIKPRCMMTRPPPLKDIHTLTDWKELQVPFSLLHKPKEILRQDPRIPQRAYSRPIDYEREAIQKTRPRLVMTPSVSMDDIEDPKARDLLVEDMYTSTVMKANVEGAPVCKNVVSPFPGLPAPAQPITLRPVRPPFVSPEWRYESIKWDGEQLRSHADATKEFWLDRTPKCRVCDATAVREQQKKIR